MADYSIKKVTRYKVGSQEFNTFTAAAIQRTTDHASLIMERLEKDHGLLPEEDLSFWVVLAYAMDNKELFKEIQRHLSFIEAYQKGSEP